MAVPEPGTKVDYMDKLEVSIEDGSATTCSDGAAEFGSASYARPVADHASRRIEKDANRCQEAGAYYVLLERSGDGAAGPEPWDVELRFVSEPGLKAAAPTQAPESWPSASPAAPAGGPQKRHGGTSFHDSTGLSQGEWQDTIKPGETLFYRVPVDWGQQLFAGADLANSPAADDAQSVSNALVLALYSPSRGFVDDDSSMYYDGKQKTVSLDPVRAVRAAAGAVTARRRGRRGLRPGSEPRSPRRSTAQRRAAPGPRPSGAVPAAFERPYGEPERPERCTHW